MRIQKISILAIVVFVGFATVGCKTPGVKWYNPTTWKFSKQSDDESIASNDDEHAVTPREGGARPEIAPLMYSDDRRVLASNPNYPSGGGYAPAPAVRNSAAPGVRAGDGFTPASFEQPAAPPANTGGYNPGYNTGAGGAPNPNGGYTAQPNNYQRQDTYTTAPPAGGSYAPSEQNSYSDPNGYNPNAAGSSRVESVPAPSYQGGSGAGQYGVPAASNGSGGYTPGSTGNGGYNGGY